MISSLLSTNGFNIRNTLSTPFLDKYRIEEGCFSASDSVNENIWLVAIIQSKSKEQSYQTLNLSLSISEI